MATPQFSIIIPTLNEEKFLPNLLASLARQTKKSFEVIVVDGKSQDKTVAAAESFVKKLPIRAIVSDKASIPVQRNSGARLSRGEWLVFIDADSVLLPYCVERLDAFIQKFPSSFVTPWGKPDRDTTQDAIFTLFYNMTIEGGLLLKRPLSPGPFTAVIRSAFDAIGGYDESLEFGEDQNLSQRLADYGVPLSIVRETLYVWSMRRFRAQGTAWSTSVYLKSALRVLFTGKNYPHMPGYIMGGHLYGKKKPVKRPVIKEFEKKLKKMMREVFG